MRSELYITDFQKKPVSSILYMYKDTSRSSISWSPWTSDHPETVMWLRGNRSVCSRHEMLPTQQRSPFTTQSFSCSPPKNLLNEAVFQHTPANFCTHLKRMENDQNDSLPSLFDTAIERMCIYICRTCYWLLEVLHKVMLWLSDEKHKVEGDASPLVFYFVWHNIWVHWQNQ